MNIDDLKSHLLNGTSRGNFDAWIATHIVELTDYFYGLSAQDLLDLKYDTDFYFGIFTESDVFKDFDEHRIHTEPFDALLFLLASASERLAEEYSQVSTINHLLVYLPESSVKYRLQALSLLQDIDDVKIDYIRLLPDVLLLLQKAEISGAESHTKELTRFLVYYFNKAQKNLSERGFNNIIEEVKSSFAKQEFVDTYRFLGHVDIQELIVGRYPHHLVIDEKITKVYYPSEVIEQHFKYNINQPVLNHPKSIPFDILMGYDKMTILNDILERGKTTFDKPYKTLSADDKVLLYCYFNMKKHFFTSLAVFTKLWETFNEIISKKTYKPVLIDLGCGPLTSGLAMGELYYTIRNKPLYFSYVGIDISEAMLSKAREFSEDRDLFKSDSTFMFYKSWNEISSEELDELAGKNNPIFFNASYLFANLTLETVEDLARFVTAVTSKYRNVHFIFQNPDRVDRNIQWNHFKSKISVGKVYSKVEKIMYKTSRHILKEPGSEEVYFEIISLK